MIKAFCDRCNREISPHIDEEYLIDINVTTTGWVGNRNEVYYNEDFNATNATRRVFLCVECLSKFNNIVSDFMYSPQQKGEIKE